MITKLTRRAGAWLVTLGLVFGGAAVATADGGKDYHKQTKASQLEMGHSKTVTGRVLATKTVKLKGTNQRHLIAQIRDQKGNKRLVDLGPRAEAMKLQLSAGDHVFARGPIAKVKGKSLMIAQRASTRDATLAIDRSMQRQQFDRVVRKAHAGMCPAPADEG